MCNNQKSVSLIDLYIRVMNLSSFYEYYDEMMEDAERWRNEQKRKGKI